MAAAVGASAAVADDDPYLWLEEVEGEKALEWVHERNKHSLGILEADERFTPLMERALKDYNAKDKIAYGTLMGGAVHNFWQDEKNVRGIWRRTSLKSYKGDEPNWITILDFDKLAEEEGENWVYKSRDCLAPDFGRCLINLSRGGGDAVVVREFDAVTKRFVDGGFETPESKQGSAWIDADTILIGTNFGEGTMTDSGYANQIKVWKRNNPLEIATLVHEGNTKDVGSFPFASHRPDGTYVGVVQAPDFFTEVIHVLDGESDDWTQKEMRPLQLPKDISFKGFFGDTVIVQMRKDWALGSKTVKAGTLVSIKVADALEGRAAASVTEIFVPTERSSIDGVSIGKDRLFLSILDEVTGQLVSAKPGPQGWEVSNLGLPENGALDVVSVDEWTDAAFIKFASFLQPDTLYAVELGGKPEEIASLPARFDASDMVTEQKFATSKDGTKVPYFVIRHKDVKMDGTTPTILYGYGGFEIAIAPTYLTGTGKLWLEEGGAYVLANIRGGGEFGPKWHQAALKENRQRAYDDFIAVGEDLVNSGFTSQNTSAFVVARTVAF